MEYNDNEYEDIPSPEDLDEQYDMSSELALEKEAEVFMLGIERERSNIRIRETAAKSTFIGSVFFVVGTLLIGWIALCYWLAT